MDETKQNRNNEINRRDRNVRYICHVTYIQDRPERRGRRHKATGINKDM